VLNLQRLYPQTSEQRSSYAEILFFTFLDPLIFRAWKVAALPYDELPPLADTDTAEHLRNRMMHILDPLSPSPRAIKSRRHLGWRICQAWWKEATACLLLSVAYAIVEFFSVIGVNRLLGYLEADGEGAIVKPWVWVLMIGVGPYLGGLILFVPRPSFWSISQPLTVLNMFEAIFTSISPLASWPRPRVS
jgi:hypothetical protein